MAWILHVALRHLPLTPPPPAPPTPAASAPPTPLARGAVTTTTTTTATAVLPPPSPPEAEEVERVMMEDEQQSVFLARYGLTEASLVEFEGPFDSDIAPEGRKIAEELVSRLIVLCRRPRG